MSPVVTFIWMIGTCWFLYQSSNLMPIGFWQDMDDEK